MKRILVLLFSLVLIASSAFSLELNDLRIDPDSGVQENGMFSLYLQTEDASSIFYINVTAKPQASTVTNSVLLVDKASYVPDDLLWYRNDGDFLSVLLLENQESRFTTYAEIYDTRENGIELYMGYVHDDLQCFGGPDDLIWSILMDGRLDLNVYDEWGYPVDEIHVTVADDTRPLLSKFSNFIKNTFKPLF
ncbi:MAG: hypothetical protein IJ863_03870 [Spirochaetales bacterium]|nr:hypothetical protein [Spirochaetales bacterium]